MKKHISLLNVFLSLLFACGIPMQAAETTALQRRVEMTQNLLTQTELQLEELKKRKQASLTAIREGDPEALEDVRMIQERIEYLTDRADYYQQRLDALQQ